MARWSNEFGKSTGFFPWVTLGGSKSEFQIESDMSLQVHTLVRHTAKGPCVVCSRVDGNRFTLRPVNLDRLVSGDVTRFTKSGQLREVGGKLVLRNAPTVG